MSKKAFFIASTGQNVGKTTTCLGLLSGLKKRFKNVSFMKPIGQEQSETPTGVQVDKDVLLVKDFFDLNDNYETMSPVLFPPGFTRDYLDGKISEKHLAKNILDCFQTLSAANDCVVIEGTGHVGVGEIVNLNNAQVAAHLGVDVVLIASGGLGSSFDALALNKTMCDNYNIHIKGVILNRVQDEKRDMVLKYMKKALDRWNIPILGAIPFDPFLSNPCMNDYCTLFKAQLLSGWEHSLRHFNHSRFVAASVRSYKKFIMPSQLIITPASREDILLATIARHYEIKREHPDEDLEAGFILTGHIPPRKYLVEELKKAHIPMFYAPLPSLTVMQMLATFTAKLKREDVKRVTEATALVENHVNFDHLIKTLSLG